MRARDIETSPPLTSRQLYVYEKCLVQTNSNLGKIPHKVVANPPSASRGPLVSCLMVTRGKPAFVKMAISQFERQTYQSRELVVVCDELSPELETLVARADGSVRLVAVPPGLTLGQLRNASVAAARGELVCQWDDDDLYGDRRLEHGVGALLAAEADVLFLRQWFVWCPSQRFLGLSRERVWEGSMIAHRQAIAPYPDLRSTEDTAMVDTILRQRRVALLDDATSYCYCIHGSNTFGDEHMQIIMKTSRLVFDHDAATEAFSRIFAFPDHPAFSKPPQPGEGHRGQLLKLRYHLYWNQLARRLKAAFSLPK